MDFLTRQVAVEDDWTELLLEVVVVELNEAILKHLQNINSIVRFYNERVIFVFLELLAIHKFLKFLVLLLNTYNFNVTHYTLLIR